MESPLGVKLSPVTDTDKLSEPFMCTETLVCQMCQRSMKIDPTLYDLKLSDIDKFNGGHFNYNCIH